MRSVFLQTLRSHRTGLAAASLGLFLISLIIVYTFDALGGASQLSDLYDSLPDVFTAMFRAQGGFGSTLTSYVALDYRHPVYVIAAMAFVLSLASGAAAREIERGTALMLLAAPIPRWRYLAAKIGALILGVAVICLAAWLGSLAGALLTGAADSLDNGTLLLAQLNAAALLLAAGAVALLISSGGSDGGRAVAWTAGILTAMYFVDFISVIWEPAGPIAPFGFFYYFDPLAVAIGGSTVWRDVAVLLAAAAVCFALALVRFHRRDITR